MPACIHLFLSRITEVDTLLWLTSRLCFWGTVLTCGWNERGKSIWNSSQCFLDINFSLLISIQRDKLFIRQNSIYTIYKFQEFLFYKKQPAPLFFYTIFTKLVKHVDTTSGNCHHHACCSCCWPKYTGSCSCRYSCNCCFFNISILFRDHISSRGSSNCKTSYTQCPCNFSSPFYLYKKIFYSAFYFYIVYIIFDCLRKFLLVFYNAPHNLLRFQEIIHKKQLLQHTFHYLDYSGSIPSLVK